MAVIRNAPLYLLPLFGLASAIPAGTLITTTSLDIPREVVPRDTPNYGSCSDPLIEMVGPYKEGLKPLYQPTNWDDFRKEVGIDTDFFYIARFICVKLKEACMAPPETIQTCWDSYGRASGLNFDEALPEKEKGQQRVDKFNKGMKGEDGVSPSPPGPTPAPESDHYAVEIWVDPSTLKLFPGDATPHQYHDAIKDMFSIKSNGDFDKKDDQKFAAGCTISTMGYKDKYANGDSLTKAMKKLMLDLMDGELIVRHGKRHTAVHCNGWLEKDGSCCYKNTIDPATGKCPDAFTYKDVVYNIFPTEFSMRASMTPNEGKGSGFMKWIIDCGKSGLKQDVWKEECDWCGQVGITGLDKVRAETLFSEALGTMPAKITMDCNSIPCR